MPSPRSSGLTVAVVGATGLVGRELLSLLEKRRFPVGKILPFSSGSHHFTVRFRGRVLPAPSASMAALGSANLVFLVSSEAVAKRYGPALAAAGIWVIDDSSAFRLHKHIPLVIPEINAHLLSPRQKLIAGPNCTVTGPAVVGYPLVKAFGAKAVRLASYQAVSGAGRAALLELLSQSVSMRFKGKTLETLLNNVPALKTTALPKPISLNVFPQVGAFDLAGNCSEENKVAEELRKIWNLPGLPVSATTVRVPVVRGHSVALWLETQRPPRLSLTKELLRHAQGVKFWDSSYPTPREAHGTWPVHVGRVRAGSNPKETCLWIVSDNLLKGAALNSIQIAEALLKRRYL